MPRMGAHELVIQLSYRSAWPVTLTEMPDSSMALMFFTESIMETSSFGIGVDNVVFEYVK